MKTVKPEPVQEEVARAINACDSVAQVAEVLGVSKPTVYFYRDGKRRLSSDHAARLEQLCGGKVTRQQMWPVSWRRIWPELAAREAAAPAANHERYPDASESISQGV